MPKAEQSLNELLYDLKRIEEHRETLTEKKIRKIYKSLMKELNAFVAEEYFLYADGKGVLSYATFQEKAREARFLEEVVKQVDGITPEIKKEMMKLVEETYTNCYQGMGNAVKKASNTEMLAKAMTDTTLRPEVLKQAFNNNISKLTLPQVLEKHRQEIIYNIKQELTIGMINGDRYEQMARRISDKVDISYNKATNIVRTESHRNIESGLFDCAENIAQSVDGSGLVYVAIWRTMKDERVRPNVRRKTKKGWKTYKSTNGADHQKMEGKTIRVGDFFEFSDGVKTKCPSKSGVARHDCNCRCFLEYDVMTEEEFAKLNSNSKITIKITTTTEKAVANSDKSGIINSGAISGALNPYSKEAEQHAEQYYESVRHMTTDTKRIAQSTGINQDKIDKIKNHIFVQEHDLLEGHKRFDPSYDMAQSWQRLTNGKFEEKDIVLLKHEYAELRYMEKGLSQSEAHTKASKRYNYAQYCD